MKEWLLAYMQDRRREVVTFVLCFMISSISFSAGVLLASDSARSPIIIQKSAVCDT